MSLAFDSTTGDFTFEFELNTSITEPSVVYLNSLYYYPQGTVTKITCDGVELTPQLTQSENFLSFTITDQAYNGKLITVDITATA